MKLQYPKTMYFGERVGDHIILARQAIGRRLPAGAEVHHIDGDITNNRNDNLVICPDHQYHHLLHARTRALEGCGNVNWRRCVYCHKWDEPKNLYIWKMIVHHRACNTVAVAKHKLKLRSAK